MIFHFLESLLIILAFIVGFYFGRDRSLKIVEKIQAIKEKLPKRVGPIVIDIDEAEIEKREKKEEKEVTLDSFLKRE